MPERAVAVGTRAPNFAVVATDGPGTARQVTLDSYADRWLILVFYSRDFSLV